MLEALETLGGNIQCASSREALMYQSATFNSAVSTTLGLLAETIREPLITDQEVEDQLKTADYEIGEIWSKPDLILPELVHMAAYKDNTLGNPLLCPKERLPDITSGLVQKYRDIFYRPERIVVAFAGVQHDEAVRLTQQYFGDMRRSEPTLSQIGSESSLSSSSDTLSDTSASSPATTPSSSPSPSYNTSKILSKSPSSKTCPLRPLHAPTSSHPSHLFNLQLHYLFPLRLTTPEASFLSHPYHHQPPHYKSP